jgi:hypothetical protein
MWADLVEAMSRNPHPSPGLEALLYAYCPRAAYWRRWGVMPQPVPDPYERALAALAAGQRVREVLREHGLEGVEEALARYLRAVRDFRSLYPGFPSGGEAPAAESAPLFWTVWKGIPLSVRYGRTEAALAFGGWEGLEQFARTMVFLAEDWARGFHMANPKEFRVARREVRLPTAGVGRPHPRYPVWEMRDGEGLDARVVWFLVRPPGEESPLLAHFLLQAGAGTELWYAFTDGTVRPADPPFGAAEAAGLLEACAEAAARGPYPPARALTMGAAGCRRCPFRPVCWPDGRLKIPEAARRAASQEA